MGPIRKHKSAFDIDQHYLTELISGRIIRSPYYEPNEHSGCCVYKIVSNGKVFTVMCFDKQCSKVMNNNSSYGIDTPVAVSGLCEFDLSRKDIVIQRDVKVISEEDASVLGL